MGFEASSLSMLAEMQKQGYQEDEVEFTDIVTTKPVAPTQIKSGELSYVPRKPRYYNSVKQGYEWNKYNQVHYDADNPPPKMV